MQKTCEQCGEPFQSKRKDARFCCGRCRVDSVRGKPKKTPWTALDAAHAAGGVPLDPADPRGKPADRVLEETRAEVKKGQVSHLVASARVAAAQRVDINALARQTIMSKVPLKKVEDDSIEARLKRLEQAMKQFAKKPAQKKGGES